MSKEGNWVLVWLFLVTLWLSAVTYEGHRRSSQDLDWLIALACQNKRLSKLVSELKEEQRKMADQHLETAKIILKLSEDYRKLSELVLKLGEK